MVPLLFFNGNDEMENREQFENLAIVRAYCQQILNYKIEDTSGKAAYEIYKCIVRMKTAGEKLKLKDD